MVDIVEWSLQRFEFCCNMVGVVLPNTFVGCGEFESRFAEEVGLSF